ncbi:hypothetical protein [Marinoscillum sp.]|uniref:hypothetical protein n=1 Tax=Marinoscillum sp. TaxID=2024838 RepID=UPI003BA8B441
MLFKLVGDSLQACMHWKVPTYHPLTQLRPGLGCHVPLLRASYSMHRALHAWIRKDNAQNPEHRLLTADHKSLVTEHHPPVTWYDILFPLKPKNPV